MRVTIFVVTSVIVAVSVFTAAAQVFSVVVAKEVVETVFV